MEHSGDSSSAVTQHHAVRFYDNDKALARIVAEFLDDGFERGSPGIVVATANQRAEILRELKKRSCDVVALERSQDLVLLDAEETLATFMVRGKPNARKFTDQMCQAIRKVCRGRTDCTVRIFGQMVDVLWQQGKRDAAIRLEVDWNQLAQTQAFSLLCGYAIGSFYKDAGFKDVCAQHSHIVSSDGKPTRVANNSGGCEPEST
jgi:DcmR-like sensory protein